MFSSERFSSLFDSFIGHSLKTITQFYYSIEYEKESEFPMDTPNNHKKTSCIDLKFG